MTVFVDTSALLAVLDAGDLFHSQAAAEWQQLIEDDRDLVSTNYVLVETFALSQRRLGMEAVQTLDRDIIPILDVLWLDEMLHRAAVTAVLTASRRRLSLVDCASFEAMRQHGLSQAFTFDRHFAEQGFEIVPDLTTRAPASIDGTAEPSNHD